MDEPSADPAILERNLAEVARANRWFGGVAPAVRAVRAAGAASVLDVGAGGGDVARALVADAEAAGRTLAVTCLDRSETILGIARRNVGVDGRFTFVLGEGEALPFGDGAFDVALSTLTLHHLEGDAAVRYLRELRRVARRTPVVCDLRRSRRAYAATLAYAYVLARDPYTRHDGPLSVRRAYTPKEAQELARAAGWNAPHVRRDPWFRMTLIDGAHA